MNIQQALEWASSELIESDSPKLDAECLLSFVLKQNRTYLYTWPENALSTEFQNHFRALVQQRIQGHPIAHLVGEKEFWGLTFKVSPSTLIPRPDTEILVETTLTLIQQSSKNTPPSSEPLKLIDLGTGSGAIACAIKHELKDSHVTAVDFSHDALDVAKFNAEQHQLAIHFYQSDWFTALPKTEQFDYILSNPPYIVENDPHLTQGDIRFEPKSALTSGSNGLRDIRTLLMQSQSYLKSGGWVIIEHGYHQAQSVQTLFKLFGYQQIRTVKDYGDQDRVTLGTRW